MIKLMRPEPEIPIKDFKLCKIKQPEYRHFWFLLIWPVYYLRYFLIEALNPATRCTVMHCPLDDLIPVCEFFLIPYGLWMVIMVGLHLFTMIYDVDTFKKYSWYMIIAFSISTITFLLFPTCQDLRPESFERENLFTKILSFVYSVDTNTNVCPSEHVIGSLAILAAALHCRYFKTPWRVVLVTASVIIISLSTVFLKQHSVIDLFAALPVCVIAYLVSFRWMNNS